ncbi:MAG: histidine phosphatase family protein [Marivibrio sp.]|uniref:histidine phosphatase family protein n=1 Tax=Marivibrio sp. TaxID=2039719 RepID=UPI0032EBBC25
MRRTVPAALALALAIVLVAAPVRAADPFPLERLADGGYALMLRHALAPGTGDPAAFELRDCSTQRTLNDVGRAQARALGEALRAAGIAEASVYSSQWCRCLETAELLGLGPVQELPALNSFFGRNRDDRPKRLEALRRFLAEQPTDGPPIILVTHQVTVTAITGDFVRSGEGRALALDGTGAPPVAGTTAAP